MLWKAALIGLFAFVVALLAFSMMRLRVQPSDQQHDQAIYNSGTQASNEDESWKALWQRTKREPVAFFTAVLAVSTTVLAVFTSLLFMIAVGQLWYLGDANKTGQNTAKAAQDSADAARDTLYLAYPPRMQVLLFTFESGQAPKEFKPNDTLSGVGWLFNPGAGAGVKDEFSCVWFWYDKSELPMHFFWQNELPPNAGHCGDSLRKFDHENERAMDDPNSANILGPGENAIFCTNLTFPSITPRE